MNKRKSIMHLYDNAPVILCGLLEHIKMAHLCENFILGNNGKMLNLEV